MMYTDNEMRKTLGKKIEISEEVERRLQDTYGQIRDRQSMTGGRNAGRHKRGMAAAAAAAVIVLSGTTAMAAYLTTHTDFMDHLFGKGGRQSQEAVEKTVDNGKGSDTTVTVPSKEYVNVDGELAETLVEPYMQDLNLVRQIGDYTLTVLNNVTDGNAGCISYTLECKDGVRAIEGTEELNEAKGAYFTDERDFYFYLEDGNHNAIAEKTVIDLEKSTETCYYLYSSYVCTNPADSLILHLEQYDQMLSELPEDAEEEIKTVMEEDIPIQTTQMPLTEVSNPENGERQFAYSSIALSLSLSNGFGLDAYVNTAGGASFVDPYYVKYIALEYADGTTYVVEDQENAVDNTNYVCAGLGEDQDVMTLVFNRMVDWSKVKKLIVNEKEFVIS